MEKIISRLRTLEENNAQLQERLTTVEESNTRLQKSNEQLEQNSEQQEAMLMTTMEAVMGVSDMISARFLTSLFNLQDRASMNKIRRRVLLDMGRNKLAVICGYQNWRDWKTHFDRETMVDSASSQLRRPAADLSDH
jgi:hypothetical protein